MEKSDPWLSIERKNVNGISGFPLLDVLRSTLIYMISLSNIRFHYPDSRFELTVPELHIERGETVALIGPSGAGKTTLLNLMAGCLLPDEGRVEVNRQDLTVLSDRRRRSGRIQTMGMVFQEFELLEYLSVLDNILLPYRISRELELTREIRRRAGDLAAEVGLADKVNRKIQRLSQGERQRVAICRALLPQPPLILADEPTGNLDPENTGHILDLLFNYVKKRDAALVSVTHEWHLLDRFSRTVDVSAFSPQITQMNADGGREDQHG